MKKFITMLTVAVLSLSLCSCGGSTPANDETTDSSVEDVSTETTTEKTDTAEIETESSDT